MPTCPRLQWKVCNCTRMLSLPRNISQKFSRGVLNSLLCTTTSGGSSKANARQDEAQGVGRRGAAARHLGESECLAG